MCSVTKHYKAHTCKFPPRSRETTASTAKAPHVPSPSQPSGLTFYLVLTLETPTELWRPASQTMKSASERSLDSRRF